MKIWPIAVASLIFGWAMLRASAPPRRFPPPWLIESGNSLACGFGACFEPKRDHRPLNGQAQSITSAANLASVAIKPQGDNSQTSLSTVAR
jgi:hypothetical protein